MHLSHPCLLPLSREPPLPQRPRRSLCMHLSHLRLLPRLLKLLHLRLRLRPYLLLRLRKLPQSLLACRLQL